MHRMHVRLRSGAFLLFVGDVLCFIAALWLSLYVRALTPPSQQVFEDHFIPFALLFLVWVGVFFIAGLYEHRRLWLLRRGFSPAPLVGLGIYNFLVSLFFFFVPAFGIAPKTVLLIYLAVSFALVLLWRAFLLPRLGRENTPQALLVGEGSEADALASILSVGSRAPLHITASVRPSEGMSRDLESLVEKHHPAFVIADWSDPRVAGAYANLYNLLSRGVRFIDLPSFYEEAFGRVALRFVNDHWLARNVSRYAHLGYDPIKRFMDIAAGTVLGIISLLFYPFIALAIKLDDGGSVIISMPRVGEGGKIFECYKFRSMSGNDRGEWLGGVTTLKVTRVGEFLRKSRLDELPQLWNVLRGDLSLIGPRPEFPPVIEVYEKEIPYYQVRHLIKPGLSGWAQLYHDNHPHHGTEVEATREKLSYDLYYLKHRSLTLDAVILLKTAAKMLTKSGA